MVSDAKNIPPGGVPLSQTLQNLKSNIIAKAPQNKSGTVSPNEFNVVDKTNSAELKPVLTQNNLSFSPASASRGNNLDISV